jgi:hypothetical protein
MTAAELIVKLQGLDPKLRVIRPYDQRPEIYAAATQAECLPVSVGVTPDDYIDDNAGPIRVVVIS